MISECYVLSLVCDFGDHAVEHGEGCADFTAQNPSSAYSKSRAAGWKTYAALRKAKCPDCAQAAKLAKARTA